MVMIDIEAKLLPRVAQCRVDRSRRPLRRVEHIGLVSWIWLQIGQRGQMVTSAATAMACHPEETLYFLCWHASCLSGPIFEIENRTTVERPAR
jgi:hypothetical protein